MIALPKRLQRTLIIMTAMASTHGASADILFASAEPGTQTGFAQLAGEEQAMLGARFSLPSAAQITGIGGVALSTGDMFAAIVPLPSPGGLPTGNVEDVAVAHAVFTADTNGDTIAPINVALPAGDYAIVLGAGAFGATGESTTILFGNVPIPGIGFMGGNQFEWFDQPPSDYRVLVEGFLTGDLDGDGIDENMDNCIDDANPDQNDTDGDGIGDACDSDLNNDCVVNVVDLGQLRALFFSDDPNADFNGDGVVNVVDLGILRSRFFASPGPSGVSNICDFPATLGGAFFWPSLLSLDLDTGTLGGSGEPGPDLAFERVTPTESYFRPLNGASITLFGTDQPTALDCKAATMSPNRLPLADVSVDDWLCARTNDGQLSRFQITGANILPLNEAFTLDIELTTFDCFVCEQAYDPTPLPNLLGWFDADDATSVVTVEDDLVFRWLDRTGNLSRLVPRDVSGQPVLTDSGINGRGSIVFDGNDDRLCGNTLVSLRPGYSVFVVAQNDVRKSFNGLLSIRDSGFVIEDGAFEMYWQPGTTDAGSGNLVAVSNRDVETLSGLRVLNPPPPVTQTYLAATGVALGDTSSGFMRVNGTAYSPLIIGSPDTPINANELCVGWGFGEFVEGNSLDGSIGEVMIFDRRLSDTEIQFVEAYLTQKWLTP